MQTFLPYPDFAASVRALDSKRLGKQRVEAWQILKTLWGAAQGWRNHPAVKMWRGYELALSSYYNAALTEWISRGYRNTMLHMPTVPRPVLPPWIGDAAFHLSHQSNLIRKLPEFYGPRFPGAAAGLPYIWPSGVPSAGIVGNSFSVTS
jgi:hypothetical protein